MSHRFSTTMSVLLVATIWLSVPGVLAPALAQSQRAERDAFARAMPDWSATLFVTETGTFIDRLNPTDLRIVTYNVNFDSIFPDENPTQAAKFVRVVNALDPDVLNLQEITRSASAVADLMDDIAPLPGGASWQTHQGYDCVTVSRYPLTMTRIAPIPAGFGDLAMALVDLPDATYAVDLYIMNDHFKCCEGASNDAKRQKQADSLVNWMRDARTPGGYINLPQGTPMMVVGDLNMVGSLQPLWTLITGNIIDEGTYGSDSPPDWDGTDSTDAHPLHNVVGPDDYTWRDDGSQYDPGRLDFVIYTDSVIQEAYKFVLNTVTMSTQDLQAAGLQRYDVTMDSVGSRYDHLPVVVDFSLAGAEEYTLTANVTGQGSVDLDPAGGVYLSGTSVQLTADADPGWSFDHWSGDLTGSMNPDSILMDSDKTVTAVFLQDQYTLTVNVTGNGSVDLDPPGGVYLSGTAVQLTGDADPGWSFDHWSGDLTGSDNPDTILMDGDKTVTAVFVQDEYNLAVGVRGRGAVTVDPPGGPYPSGTPVELTANADAHWYFDHWEDDLAGTDNPAAVVMDDDKVITAIFLQDCAGDCNYDGFRNVSDFSIFAGAYGSQIGDGNYLPEADLNSDGFVNATDFTLFAGEFGQACP
jgi:endonuclease/exonuclease/phosphatase family metal-dependent hydrolase